MTVETDSAWSSLFQTIYILINIHKSTQNDKHTFGQQQISCFRNLTGSGKRYHAQEQRWKHVVGITRNRCKFSPRKQSRSREKKMRKVVILLPWSVCFLYLRIEFTYIRKLDGFFHTGGTCFPRQGGLFECCCTLLIFLFTSSWDCTTIILYYIILCYVILYYIILYYHIILYYIASHYMATLKE